MQEPSDLKWEGRWDQLKGKARQAWGNLTDDDLDVAEGNYEELIGRIKEKTGESAEEIRDRLEAADSNY
ncbi:MAG: CsbD family protein [Acidimicrobiia bacterium]